MRLPFRRRRDLGGDGLWTDRLTDAEPPAGFPYRTPFKHRAYVIMAWLVWPVAVMLAINQIVMLGAEPDSDAGHGNGSVARSPTRADATYALQTWLDQEPAPLPGGEVVAWKSSRLVRRTGTDDDGNLAPRVDTHTFVLATASGRFTATLSLASSSEHGSTMMGAPSLQPVRSTSDDFPSADLWPGLDPVNTPDPVSAAITVWADAYAGGTTDQLRQIVGDPDPEHAYLPLKGVAADEIDIVESAAVPSDDADNTDTAETSATMLVRVSLSLRWTGHDSEPSAPRTDDQSEVGADAAAWEFDLRIEEADTAAPRVVAWGGPGSGPALRPYANAVRGEITPAQPSSEPQGDG